mmetsp:Transcript_109268/g.305709  ORF Transcript_109268/g.305709 Transcript_109268/m.305709 type:complete len:127 (+) Transcript_109268:59-439(+)
MQPGMSSCQHCAQQIQEGMDIFMCRDSWYCSRSCRRQGHTAEGVSRTVAAIHAMMYVPPAGRPPSPPVALPTCDSFAAFAHIGCSALVGSASSSSLCAWSIPTDDACASAEGDHRGHGASPPTRLR